MACYYLRDQDGYCHLTNRCWVGKPCPKNDRQAEAARQQLIREVMTQRDAAERARLPKPE